MPGQGRRRASAQALLGGMLTLAGITHLTVAREEFRAQVPPWSPVDPDVVVVASGVVEIGLGSALLTTWKQPARARLGVVVAAFFQRLLAGDGRPPRDRRHTHSDRPGRLPPPRPGHQLAQTSRHTIFRPPARAPAPADGG
jgi:uncharacterized membrane protein